MNPQQPGKQKSSWPKQAAIVISESPNMHMLLRELLRTYGWTVIDSTPSADRAIELVRTGQVFMVICDDTQSVPVTKHVRHLLCDPVTLCTPTLAFMLEAHKGETNAVTRMGRPSLADKPLTPSKFIPAFTGLVRTWEKEPWIHVRRAGYMLVDGNEATAMKILAKLSENPLTSSLCGQAIAMHLRRTGKLKDAEGVMLAALKKAPKEVGNVLALADIYMHGAMPKLAHRLLASARGALGNSLALVPDIVQAAILMGKLDDAIDNLYSMQKGGFLDEETTAFLARLLFAEGREDEAEKVLNNNKAVFKRLQNGWAAAETQPLNAAG